MKSCVLTIGEMWVSIAFSGGFSVVVLSALLNFGFNIGLIAMTKRFFSQRGVRVVFTVLSVGAALWLGGLEYVCHEIQSLEPYTTEDGFEVDYGLSMMTLFSLFGPTIPVIIVGFLGAVCGLFLPIGKANSRGLKE
ncbi:hypothetical protein [Flexibacterium corallicola]|uniref:hypothetical protein n=1 Tax=Flexibacterium corallicola TaxID=3037259 RepID=UPI00286F25AC|nr:hypothetical protein [Pseudovibrio sp. M1P-2-3]